MAEPYGPSHVSYLRYTRLISAKLISTGVSRPNSSTLIVTLCFCAFIAWITPTVSAHAPATTCTVSPNKNKVATITKAQVEEIAKTKMPDLNAATVEAAASMIAGTCRSMGVTVVD